MLVLQVRPFKKVFVGNDITIINVNDQAIKIGVTAPNHVNILREEVIKKNKGKVCGQIKKEES